MKMDIHTGWEARNARRARMARITTIADNVIYMAVLVIGGLACAMAM